MYSEFEEDRLAPFFGLLQKLLPETVQSVDEADPIPTLLHRNEVLSDVLENRQRAMVASSALRMHAKRLVTYSSKLVGLEPMTAREDDCVVVLLGCAMPVVLRDSDGHWELVGEIYVDGIMFGEAMDEFTKGDYYERDFDVW